MEKPNILLIICDALRPDHLGCYGYTKNTSPFIDKLASQGCIFENTIANCNHTLPGLISIFTGLYQTRHLINSPKSFQLWGELWKGKKTPFHLLKENGYLIAGPDKEIYKHMGYDIEIKDVKEFIYKNKNKTFFLWYRLEFTHLPYNPPPPYDKMFLPENCIISKETEKKLEIVKTKMIIHRKGLVSRAESGTKDPIEKPNYERTYAEVNFEKEDIVPVISLYDGEIRVLDIEIESYIKVLEEVGILDKTIVIITADHGEQLFERGALGHSSCSLEGNLYDENIKIPFIVFYPYLINKGLLIKKQVSQVDIMPTLFDMLNLKMEEKPDGISLFPLMKGENFNYKEECFAMTQPAGWQALEEDERMIYCIRTPEWKLIYNYDPKNEKNTYYELYNLKEDREERENLTNKNLKIEEELKIKLHNFINQ